MALLSHSTAPALSPQGPQIPRRHRGEQGASFLGLPFSQVKLHSVAIPRAVLVLEDLGRERSVCDLDMNRSNVQSQNCPSKIPSEIRT